jgi:hypothetical protein
MSPRERGQGALLLVAGALALATAPALALQRTVARELAMEGEALRGARADLAADSVLDWFLSEGWTALDACPQEGGADAPDGIFRPGPGTREGGSVHWRRLGSLPEQAGSLYRVRVRAFHRVPAGTFVQEREAYFVQSPGCPPVFRAWRILR